jgi:hypothetical protein
MSFFSILIMYILNQYDTRTISVRCNNGAMRLFVDLFTTDYGLVAVAATVVAIGLAVGFHLFFQRKIRESEQASEEST